MSSYGMGPFGSGPFGRSPEDENNQQPNWLTVPPDDFEDLETDEVVDLLVSWFHENFEDPAERMPRDSEADYGYAFIEGGPYDSREILNDFFYDSIGEEPIELAVRELERTASVWAPKPNVRPYHDYVVTDDGNIVTDNDDIVVVRLPYERYEALESDAKRAARTAEKIENILLSNIGHNNPPEPIEGTTFSHADIKAIRQELSNLARMAERRETDFVQIQQSINSLKQKKSIFKNFAEGLINGVGKGAGLLFIATAAGTENGKNLILELQQELDAVISAAITLLG